MAQDKLKDDGGVSKKVSDAKKALEDAKNNPKIGTQSGHNYIGEPPKLPVPAAPKVPKAPSSGLLGEVESAGEGIRMRAEQMKDIPKMHEGGKVEEDGPKNLKKGETVLPKDKDKAEKLAMEHLGKKAKGVMSAAIDEEKDEPKAEEKHESKKEEKAEGKHKGGKKPKFHRTEIEHHPNGSHTVRHHPHPPKMGEDGKMPEAEEPVSYGAPDYASLRQGMDQHLGDDAAAEAVGGGQGGKSPEPAAL